MGFPGAHNVRRNPQGLGVARDVTAPQIDVLHGRLAANHPSHFGDAPLGTHRQKELELNIVRVPKCETGAVRSIQDRTVLDTQGIESCWPGFEFFSTRATKGDVVESDSKFAARKLSSPMTPTGGDPKRRSYHSMLRRRLDTVKA